MTDECQHHHVTHTDGWPVGGVGGGAFLFPPSDRCDDCGRQVTKVTDSNENETWVLV